MRPPPPRPGFALALALALALGPALACATYTTDLRSSFHHYEVNEDEQTLALVRALEADYVSMKPEERTRYCYVRGMTDVRLSSPTYDVRADARYWLGLAKASQTQAPNALSDAEKERLAKTLDDLNHEVYGVADASVAPPGAAGAAGTPAVPPTTPASGESAAGRAGSGQAPP